MTSPRLQAAIAQIQKVRDYTNRLVDTIPPAEWFRMPAEGVTHVAWQVGHLAMAEYRLLLHRIRGLRSDDEGLISSAFLKQFGRESIPDPNPASYPSLSEIRTVFDRVHAQAMRELPDVPDAVLDQAPAAPHPLFSTNLGAIQWCPMHEMSHAGQIGLLRRLFGARPLW